jgi:hypothetical protein
MKNSYCFAISDPILEILPVLDAVKFRLSNGTMAISLEIKNRRPFIHFFIFTNYLPLYESLSDRYEKTD